MMFNHLQKSIYDKERTSFSKRKLDFFVPEIGDPILGALLVKFDGLIIVGYCNEANLYFADLAVSGVAFTLYDFDPSLKVTIELFENRRLIEKFTLTGRFPERLVTSANNTQKSLGLVSGRIFLPDFSQNLSVKISMGFNFRTGIGSYVFRDTSYTHMVNQLRIHYLNPR